jgi:hypothetical protein
MQLAGAMLAVAVLFAPVTQQYPGAEWNKKSTLSTDRPVEFPGIVLQPGVYVIKLRDGGDRRSFVQILNQDETQVLATIIAVPDHRLRPEGDSEFVFHEIKTPGPVPVQTWFYSGDLVGLEFVYPKPRAQQIARETADHVMASNNDKDGAIVAVTPNGKEVLIDGVPSAMARRKPQ